MPPGGGPRNMGFMTEEEKQNAPKVSIALLKRVFSYLIPYWKQLVLVMVCLIVSSAFSILPSILTGKIIDEGLIGRSLNRLVFYILLSLGVPFASSLIGVLQS